MTWPHYVREIIELVVIAWLVYKELNRPLV